MSLPSARTTSSSFSLSPGRCFSFRALIPFWFRSDSALTRDRKPQGCRAAKVSHLRRSPVLNPVRSQRTRCSLVPCVNPSGTT